MKAAIYIRVSTTMQVNEGVSLDAQTTKLLQYCELNNFEVMEIISDAGLSGKNTNRPGYLKLMELVKSKQIDAVVVYSLSRFARNTVDTLESINTMNKKGVQFHSFTEKIDTSSSIGRFFLTTIASLSQLEREQLAERTTAALQYKKTQNERVGQIPFGWQLCSDGVHLEHNQAEQQAIKFIKDLHATGFSYNEIAMELELRQITNKSGIVKWNKTQIYRIINKAA